MKRALLLIAALLASCGPQPAGEPVMRTEIGSGVAEGKPAASPSPTASLASACTTTQFEGASLTHCIADPARHRVALMLDGKDGKPARALAAIRDALPDASRIAFAMNGGMFDGEGKPIGYYVEQGNRRKELNQADGPGNFHMKPNGVFFGSGSKWQVRTAEDFFANVGDRPDFGTQSGPMLLIEGKLHPEITENGPSRAVRNGVGVDAAGRAHFVISSGPVSFGLLARYFRDVAKTPNALYLDGSVSALWDPPGNRLDAGAPIGPVIVVETKE